MQGSRWRCSTNINLTIAEQAIVGLLGASGSGKSTLLNIISGIIKPDRGLVCICGAASDESNDWCAISYMFQDDRLLPWRTAIRNVEFALEADHCPRRNVLGAHAKRYGSSNWKDSKKRSLTSFPAA